MLDSLITSKTRIKLLLKFFLNSNTKSYLRSLATEFKESTNSVRLELNKLTDAGILEANPEGNTIMYKANSNHPLFPEISKIVEKYFGFDKIIDQILIKMGDLKLAFITGDYARGQDTGVIDLVLVGNVNKIYLISLVEKVEAVINRKIRYLILTEEEYEKDYKDMSGHKILIF
jgi:DNA-binding transcriptional ArsR family regulator